MDSIIFHLLQSWQESFSTTGSNNLQFLMRNKLSVLRPLFWVNKMNKLNLTDERLPFPTKLVQAPIGIVEEYIIPYDKKKEVLKKLYPFTPVPSLEATMTDIHENKKFKVKEFCVTREGEVNVLVSPYYFISGGTVIDWC